MHRLAPRLRSTFAGLLYGGLCSVLLAELGLLEILPNVPPGAMLLVGMSIGAAFGAAAREAWVANVDAVLIVGYLLVALTPITGAVAPMFVRRDPLQHADAVISLSASVRANGALNTYASDRLLTTAELIKQGWAPRLVTTRVIVRVARRDISSDSGQREIVRLAGLTAPWTIVAAGRSTHDEATHSAAALFPEGIKHVIVVTSPVHSRRACATFEAVGFTVTCIPAREHGDNAGAPVTSRDRGESFRQMAYEVLGMIEYRIRGWIR